MPPTTCFSGSSSPKLCGDRHQDRASWAERAPAVRNYPDAFGPHSRPVCSDPAPDVILHRHACARFCEWLRGVPIAARLWLLDRIAGPYPETEADRIREREKHRLQSAFPGVEIDGTGGHEP